jgi:hypothetical protein
MAAPFLRIASRHFFRIVRRFATAVSRALFVFRVAWTSGAQEHVLF